MKKFSPMDIVAMKMQEIGNDRFLLGISNHADTAEELVTKMIESLQDYLERNKDTIKDKKPFGFRINLELFEKGEEAIDKFK